MSGIDARSVQPGDLPEAPFPPVRHAFRVHLSDEAFDRATGRGDEHADREIGGILVGDVCRDEGGAWVRVDTTIDALHAEEQGTELTFTHATWEHIHKEMDTRHQGKRIVGWYHTHPGFGVFLSDRDEFIHRSFFNLPYQVALVYDPKSREHGVFVWRDNEPRRARRHWVGEREHIWDGAPRPRAPERPSPAAEAKMPAEPKTPAPTGEPPDRFGLLLGGLTLAIIGGLLGWLLGRWSAGDDIERLERQVNAQRLIGAEQAYKTLNTDLLALLDDAMAEGALRAAIGEGVAAIDRSLRAAEEGSGGPNVEELLAARARLQAIARDHELARRTLELLARESEGGPADTRPLKEAVAVQRALLGQLCAEVAELTKDEGAARRLLLNAIQVDPGNREMYEKRLEELKR